MCVCVCVCVSVCLCVSLYVYASMIMAVLAARFLVATAGDLFDCGDMVSM